jgi:hypothetical protein
VSRYILDVSGYLNLVKEGNDAIRKKEIPLLELRAARTFYLCSEGLHVLFAIDFFLLPIVLELSEDTL